jgi:kynurenine formamidase
MVRRIPALTLASLLCVAACSAPESAGDGPGVDATIASVFDGTGGDWIDLTHAFSSETLYWPTDTVGFELEQLAYGFTEGGWFYSSNAFRSAEHGGTHLDAPIHFAIDRLSTDHIPLDGLIGPAAVVDVSDRATPDYQVSVSDLEEWEARHGPLPEGGILLLATGWSRRWPDRAAYLGTDRIGPDAVADLRFPGLSPEAAQWLVDGRGIVAVGIDTASLDYGRSQDFASHVILFEDNIAGFENVTDLDRLPPVGAYVVALPMKIERGSGGPLRIVAFVPRSSDSAGP